MRPAGVIRLVARRSPLLATRPTAGLQSGPLPGRGVLRGASGPGSAPAVSIGPAVRAPGAALAPSPVPAAFVAARLRPRTAPPAVRVGAPRAARAAGRNRDLLVRGARGVAPRPCSSHGRAGDVHSALFPEEPLASVAREAPTDTGASPVPTEEEVVGAIVPHMPVAVVAPDVGDGADSRLPAVESRGAPASLCVVLQPIAAGFTLPWLCVAREVAAGQQGVGPPGRSPVRASSANSGIHPSLRQVAAVHSWTLASGGGKAR